ncbi:hypothetical protein ACF0H5_013337 [Mactra antiquata]
MIKETYCKWCMDHPESPVVGNEPERDLRSVWGSKTKSSIPLPSFRETPTTYKFSEGAVAVLYCSIQNLGSRQVIWRKNTFPNPLTIGTLVYAPDDRLQVHHIPEKGEWNLFIKNLQQNDSGLYECQVSSKEKYFRRLIRVIVLDRPYADKAIVIQGPQEVNKGEDLVLSCNATGGKSAPNDLDWVKDNQILMSDKSGRINITKYISLLTNTIISNLTIKNVSPLDDGEYECRTTDAMVKTFTVEVKGESSEKPKRMIPQQAPATSCANTSTYILYVIVFCVHCSFRFRKVFELLTPFVDFTAQNLQFVYKKK